MLRDEVAGKNLQLSDQNYKLAQAQDNEIHLATLKERNRIAREIHDNVGHMLTRSLLQSGALLVINKDEQLREPLESLRSTLDSAMTSIRESVHDLHDDSIDLEKVLNDSINTVDSRFTVDLDCDIGANVPGNIKLCIIGIVKEGISNAVKHSTGDRISIVIREHPAFYQLMLKDNGSCSEIKESGIGLKNMRDRAEALKGVITFTPSEEGFRIFMSIPKA
jgi:signal transduction histidine kinase